MNLLYIAELQHGIEINLAAANCYLDRSDNCLKQAAAYRTDAAECTKRANELMNVLEEHAK